MSNQSEETNKVAAKANQTQGGEKDECPICRSNIDENAQNYMLPLISLSHGLQKKASEYYMTIMDCIVINA